MYGYSKMENVLIRWVYQHGCL